MKVAISDITLFSILARTFRILSPRLVITSSTGHIHPGILPIGYTITGNQLSEQRKTVKHIGQIRLLFRAIQRFFGMVSRMQFVDFQVLELYKKIFDYFQVLPISLFMNLAFSWYLHLETDCEFFLVQAELVHSPQQLEPLRSFLRRMQIRTLPPTGNS